MRNAYYALDTQFFLFGAKPDAVDHNLIYELLGLKLSHISFKLVANIYGYFKMVWHLPLTMVLQETFLVGTCL